MIIQQLLNIFTKLETQKSRRVGAGLIKPLLRSLICVSFSQQKQYFDPIVMCDEKKDFVRQQTVFQTEVGQKRGI